MKKTKDTHDFNNYIKLRSRAINHVCKLKILSFFLVSGKMKTGRNVILESAAGIVLLETLPAHLTLNSTFS